MFTLVFGLYVVCGMVFAARRVLKEERIAKALGLGRSGAWSLIVVFYMYTILWLPALGTQLSWTVARRLVNTK